MQLIYKHSSPNDQHMISYWKLINKMLEKIYVRKLRRFQPHSLLCHLWCIFSAICSFSCDIRYDHIESWRSSFDKLFFLIIYNYFTLLVNCINTAVLAEQSLHHNIILEKLDHSSVSRVYRKSLTSGPHITSLSSTERQIAKVVLLVHMKSNQQNDFCHFILSFLSRDRWV